MNEFINFVKNNFNQLSNILIVNNEKITIEDVEDLSRYIQNIYVILDNRFSYTRFFIKLRSLKNVHVINSNRIPNINYDVLSIFKCGQNEQSIISLIKTLKYIFIEYNDGTIKINNFTQISSYCFQRNNKILDLDKNEEAVYNNKFNSEIENHDQNKNEQFVQNSDENDFNTLILNVKIDIKNIVPVCINYLNDKTFKRHENYGRLDVLCIINEINDFNFFNLFLEKNQYSNIKYFIFLNKFKEKMASILKLKKINFDLYYFNEQHDKNVFKNIFNELSNGEYKINMYDYDFNKDITEIIK